jgi:ABC-2 type transport system permease protein
MASKLKRTRSVAEPAAANIYDLGYQRYSGVRLGRRHAIWALYRESLRGAFGLGRSTTAKIAPAALILIAVGPAIGQLAAGLLGAEDVKVVRHDSYYGLVILVLALYVAVIAPDIVGRDQRDRTLTLYFTRAISRMDYAFAKFLALTSAMLLITLMPQLVLFVANALVADSFGKYLLDDLDQLAPIFGTALLGSALLASIGAAIAAQTPQRVFATVGIVATFLLTAALSAAMVHIDSPVTRLAIFASPQALLEGSTAWMFSAPPNSDSLVVTADFPVELYAPVTLAVTGACYAMLARRYRKVQP